MSVYRRGPDRRTILQASKELYEVTLCGGDVSPGYYYDDKSRLFSKAHGCERLEIENSVQIKFEVVRWGTLEFFRKGSVCKGISWINDYIYEDPDYAFMVKGASVLEKKGVGIPVDNERNRVLSVLHKYRANLLMCFSGEISESDLKIFEELLDSLANKVNVSVLPSSFVKSFSVGYIYPSYSGPGRQFDKIMYGVKEFCSILENAKVSTVPVSAKIRCPSVNPTVSISHRDPASDAKTSGMQESKIEVKQKATAGGTNNSNNLPCIHFEGSQKKDNMGHGKTKMTGASSDLSQIPGVTLGRGRGTMIGRGNGNDILVPQHQEVTRYKAGEDRKSKPLEALPAHNTKEKALPKTKCICNLRRTTEQQEGRPHEPDEDIKDAGIHVGSIDIPVTTATFVSSYSIHVTCKSSCSQSEVLTEHCLKTHMGSSAEGDRTNDKKLMAMVSQTGSKLENEDVKRPSAAHIVPYALRDRGRKLEVDDQKSSAHSNITIQENHDDRGGLHTHIPNNSCKKTHPESDSNYAHQKIHPESGNQDTEVNKDEFKKEEKIPRSSDIATKKIKETGKEGNLNKQFHKKGVQRQESGSQKTKDAKRGLTPKKETQKGDNKAEKSAGKSSHDEKDSDSKEEGTVSERSNTDTKKMGETSKKNNLNKQFHKKDVPGQKSGSQKTDNAKRVAAPNKEAQKGKDAEKCTHGIKDIDSTNVLPQGGGKNGEKKENGNCSVKAPGKSGIILQNEKLYQGLAPNEDNEEDSFMKIRSRDIATTKRRQCTKEENQMKTKYLEATKTFQDELGFQRRYYGIVNDTSLEKVILLLGASGSGKTTLINFAANYFKEKKSADDELYHVVAPLPTTEVIAYTFCRSNDEIPITIIDTPGLNDSSGAEVRDHVQSLKTFIANASACDFKIHAIGFVAQAYLVRLTSSERLVMDYVSTIFGQGFTDHLITFVTFADNQDNPPVVEAMKNYGVSFKLSLKFNNSALHNNEADEVDDIDRVYWRVCWRNWKKCLKALIDLSPLSVNTMKAVQSEVFSSTVLKSIERNLNASLRAYFSYPKEERLVSMEVTKICSEIWNLVAVLNHLRSANEGGYNSLENTISEFALEVCKSQQVSADENIYFLSLCIERPLVLCGSQVICNMAAVYKEAKAYHSKSGTFAKNVDEWMYCQHCLAEHSMIRIDLRSRVDKFFGSAQDVVSLKCVNCQCPGDMHGVSAIESPFHPDKILASTRSALQEVITQHSLPHFPIPEGWYLKFLNYFLNREYEDFIKEIFNLMKSK